jgi:hypothetical protein
MRTLIYKRTHSNDPDPKTGVFGNRDCMGSVRCWDFDAVIGIGGVGQEPKNNHIAGKLTWIGIGPQKLFDNPDSRGPRVTFRHFWYLGENGPLLEKKYQALAIHMYETHRRQIIHAPSSAGGPDLDRDVEAILRIARASPPSSGPADREFRASSDKCRARPVGRAVCSTRRRPSKSRGRA